ncbi:MAG: hypothetical protein IT480_10745 [Gammaproteobacteria bacterium]|nr:hypothetical protein [Gammaproteobacteria bacterium]
MEMLGHTPFVAWNATTDKHHKAVERAWPDIRDKVLARHPWDCAITRALLTKDAFPPAFGFSARFMLPLNWLRTLSIGDDYRKPRYQIEAGWILADAEELPIRYIYRAIDINRYPPHLVALMKHAVVAHMAYAVTGSTTKADAMQGEFERQLMIAAAVDSAEEDGEILGDFLLLRSRF